MELFKPLDAYVLLYSKGVYKQAQLFERGEYIYAKYGNGFIGLRYNGGTTVPTCRWVDSDGELKVDNIGRVTHVAIKSNAS